MGMFLKITVEDNGVGVSEDARHLLFRPFQKAQAKVSGVDSGRWVSGGDSVR